MKKKLLTSILMTLIFVSSFPFLNTHATNAVGYMKITLLDVYIINDHDGLGLGDGEIYFNFNVNGSEFGTAQYSAADGDNITLNFVLFDSLIEDQSNLYIYTECMEADTLDTDDFVGEYNFTALPLDIAAFVVSYGNREIFTHTNLDAIFYLEVYIDDTVIVPPEIDETPYLTITLISAVIHDKHEAIGKGNGEIYFHYEIFDTKRSTVEIDDVEDGETVTPSLEIYKGPLVDDELKYTLICYEADIDSDDILGGFAYLYPVFSAEWWRNNRSAISPLIVAISDVTFNLQIEVTYPAVPGKYGIIGLKDEAVILFNTSRDAQITVHFGTSPGALVNVMPITGFRKIHVADITDLLPLTKYYFKVETTNLDGEVYVDDNHGDLYSFETINDLPIYLTMTKNLGLEELYYKDLTGGISFVNFSIGLFAGLYVPLLFTQKTPLLALPGESISSEVTVLPEEGFAGAEVIGEVSVYGYKLQLFDPISYFYDFMTPFGDLTLYSFSYSYPLGSLNKTDDIYSIDVTAGIDVLFEIGIYLETNVSMGFSGAVDDGSTAEYIIDEGSETAIHVDTISASASDGDTAVCAANGTLQFNNLYFRIKSLNLSVVGSIDTIVTSNPSIDFTYEVVGDTGLFAPITFPVLNDLLFPVVLKNEDLETITTIDTVDPKIDSLGYSIISGNTYSVTATATDNRAIWDVKAEVEYEDASVQTFTLDHVSGDNYAFTLVIPDGESVTVTITTRDVAGRIDTQQIVIDNPPDIPEFSKMNVLSSMLVLPLAIFPIIFHKKRKKY